MAADSAPLSDIEKSLENRSTKGGMVTSKKDSEQSDGRPTDVIGDLPKKK